ncbi:MAG: ATP-binding protein [Mariniblastus sp.]
MSHLLLYICFITGLVTCHQGQSYDSLPTKELEKRLVSTETPRDRLEILKALCVRHYDPDASFKQRMKWCEEALSLAEAQESEGVPSGATLHNAMGVAKMQAGDPDEAVKFFAQAIESARETGDQKTEYKTRNNFVAAMVENGASFQEVNKEFQWLMENSNLALGGTASAVKSNYGNFLIRNNRELEAIKPLEKSQAECIKSKNYDYAMISTMALAELGIQIESYYQARHWMENLQPLKDELPDNERKWILDCYYWIIESNLGREQDALKALDKFDVFIGSEKVTPFYEHIYWFAKSTVMLKLHRPDEALASAKKSLNAVKDLDARTRFNPAVLIAKSYVEFGDFDAADNVVKEYEPLFESNPRVKQQLEHSVQRKKMEIYQVEASTSRQKIESALLIGVGLCLLVLTTGFVWYKSSRNHQRSLLEKEQQQNAKLKTLVEAKTESLVKEFERQAELEKELAERKRIENLGGLVSNFAHDFNNLLQVIKTSNEIIGTSVSGKLATLLQSSDRCVETAEKTIQQLLASSKNQYLQPEYMFFSDYLTNHVEIFRAALSEKNKLTINDQSEKAVLPIDQAKMTNALLNLLSNASHAMPHGGEVHLSTALKTAEQLDRQGGFGKPIDSNQKFLQIVVKDNGEGMTEENRQRVFKPFFSTKRKGVGTGLGLSSVCGFVNQSGGEIQLSSELNRGTEVTMYFPIRGAISNVNSNDSSLEGTDFTTFKILLVEDNLAVANSIILMLESVGASGQHVKSGDEAIEILTHAHEINHVVTDISMPGKFDGVSLATWIQENQAELSFTLVSGNNGREETNGMPVLPKPFSRSDLLIHISQSKVGSA